MAEDRTRFLKQSPGLDRPPDRLARLLLNVAPTSREASRRALIDSARVRPFARGEVIIPQGGRSELALLMEGFVAARRTSADGRSTVPMILGSGNLLGPVVLAGQEALYDFVPLAPGVAAHWAGAAVRSLAAEDAGLALGLLDVTLVRFAELTAQLDTMHYQDARRRVARVLVRYRDLCFGERPAVTRTDLAMLVGTSREMTRRVLRMLVAEGIVDRLGRSGLRLLDPERLNDLARLRPDRAVG